MAKNLPRESRYRQRLELETTTEEDVQERAAKVLRLPITPTMGATDLTASLSLE